MGRKISNRETHDWDSLQDRYRDISPKGTTDTNWLGGTATDLLEKMRTGDEALAERAEDMFDRALSICLEIVTEGAPVRSCSPVGAYPNVPAYLAGHPANMYTTRPTEGLGPIRILANMFCWAGVRSDEQLERGMAITALAYAMQTVRPVTLALAGIGQDSYGSNGHNVIDVNLDTTPLDLSRVVVAMSHIGIGRRLITYRKPDGDCATAGRFGEMHQTEAFDLAPEDIYIPLLIPQDVDRLRNGTVDAMDWVLECAADQDTSRLADTKRDDRLSRKRRR